MRLARFLDESRVDLALDAAFGEERPADTEAVAEHMAGLLVDSPDVVNASKLRLDLVHVERRKPSLLGQGIYMPHVRTMQARRMVMAVGVSQAGLPLGAPDDVPVRLVVACVGPPYDDRTYLLVQRRLGERLMEDGFVDRLTACSVPGEVLRALDT